MFYQSFNSATEAEKFQADMKAEGFLCYTVSYNVQHHEVRYWML